MDEVGKYHKRAVTNRENGGKGGRPKTKNNPVGSQSEPNRNPNQEPITNNHKPTTNTKPKTAPAVPLPDWLDEASWCDYLETRKVMKSPMTDRAKLLAIAKLHELRQSGHDPTAVLNQSIYNGWKGLFPIKQDQAKGKTRHEQHAEFVAAITGKSKRQPFDDPSVIHGTAERVD
jgi:hypothetical protein